MQCSTPTLTQDPTPDTRHPNINPGPSPNPNSASLGRHNLPSSVPDFVCRFLADYVCGDPPKVTPTLILTLTPLWCLVMSSPTHLRPYPHPHPACNLGGVFRSQDDGILKHDPTNKVPVAPPEGSNHASRIGWHCLQQPRPERMELITTSSNYFNPGAFPYVPLN